MSTIDYVFVIHLLDHFIGYRHFGGGTNGMLLTPSLQSGGTHHVW